MRIAFLADIHGNLPALEAVVADLADQSPDAVYLVGDQINRCPWNNQVMDLLVDRGWPAIYGNHDWVVGCINTPDLPVTFQNRQRFPSLWWTHEMLRPDHLVRVRSLPAEMRLAFDGAAPIRMLHGVPGNPFVGLLPFTIEEKLADLIDGIAERIIVAGHTHRPMDRCIGDKRGHHWRIFNGGSVGLPYNGDPRAQYLLLDWTQAGWQPTFRAIDYDHASIPAAFESSGMIVAAGASAELHLRTVMTGQPWSSDFGHWMGRQPPEMRQDMPSAIRRYLATHGPGNWSFLDE